MARWTCDEFAAEIHRSTGILTEVTITGPSRNEVVTVSHGDERIAIASATTPPKFLAAQLAKRLRDARESGREGLIDLLS